MNVRNHIHLTGNLGADPKTVTLANGRSATQFRLATNKYYRNAEGERRTATEWHTVKAYGKLADLFDRYLRKGSPISVVGSMQYRSWTDKFDQPRREAEVIAEEFTFLGGKTDSAAVAEATHTEDAITEMMAAEPEAPATVKKRRAKRAAKRPSRTTASRNMGEVIESVEALEQ